MFVLCIFPYYWQDDIKNISCNFNRGIGENYTIKSTIDAVKYSNTIQLSPFKCNDVYCYIDVSGNRLKYLMIFNRGIDTMKITALFNHKPGILNNYIIICFDWTILDYGRQIVLESFLTVMPGTLEGLASPAAFMAPVVTFWFFYDHFF